MNKSKAKMSFMLYNNAEIENLYECRGIEVRYDERHRVDDLRLTGYPRSIRGRISIILSKNDILVKTYFDDLVRDWSAAREDIFFVTVTQRGSEAFAGVYSREFGTFPQQVPA